MQQNLVELQEERQHTIIAGDSNSPLAEFDKSTNRNQ